MNYYRVVFELYHDSYISTCICTTNNDACTFTLTINYPTSQSTVYEDSQQNRMTDNHFHGIPESDPEK